MTVMVLIVFSVTVTPASVLISDYSDCFPFPETSGQLLKLLISQGPGTHMMSQPFWEFHYRMFPLQCGAGTPGFDALTLE